MSVPRIAAIEFPEGRLFGQPGDVAGQTAVLRAALRALEGIPSPGGIVQLPFEWLVDDGQSGPLPETPPIVRLIQRQPWLLPRLLRRDPPN